MTCIRRRVFVVSYIRGKLIVGENWCRKPQEICPRHDKPSGVGYEMCRDICQQPAHAEINLINAAGGDLEGSDVIILGIDHICESCKSELKKANVGKIIIQANEVKDGN